MLDHKHDKIERRLKRVKIGLVRNPKFALWSGILMMGKTELSDNVPTAMTNGCDEVYGRQFVQALSDQELGFVILHENLHKAFRHMFLWRKLYDENPQLANMACDYVINLIITKCDPSGAEVTMPVKDGKPMGLLDKRFEGMNSKQVYDILKQEQDEQGQSQGGTGFDEHDWESGQNLSEDEKEALARDIDHALRRGEMEHKKVHGAGAGNTPRELEDLLRPKIDWRDALREFVSTVCANRDTSSWRRPNRRFLHSGIYMPTMAGHKVGRIAIGVDTSGSIAGEELTRFLSEVHSIAEDVRPEWVDLIYWDAQVASHETYESDAVSNIVSSTRPLGGGGTDPTCMMRYMKDKSLEPECIVMLTDGYVDGRWGNEWPAPIVWVVTGPSKFVASSGKTIHIKG